MIGCSYPGLAPVADQTVDALAGPVETTDALAGPPPSCAGTGRDLVCLVAPPSSTVAISADTAIDTGTSSMCAQTAAVSSGYCVIAATDLTVSAKLGATGARPLILLASHTIHVTTTGTVDVGSHGGQAGAGADPVACPSIAASSSFFATGGTGGSFVGLGGRGGGGGSAPGAAAATIDQIRGGCAGQNGIVFFGGGDAFGPGGHGGGAVYLIAGDSIDVSGEVLATGQGGGGGPMVPGAGEAGGSGGGGGAGGMIGLDAPSVTASGLLLASGGGGGGGGNSGDGSAGADPTAVAAAAGGAGDPVGDPMATGGAGSAPTPATAAGSKGTGSTAETACSLPAGSGGGGGGAGVIYAPTSAKLDHLSPPATAP